MLPRPEARAEAQRWVLVHGLEGRRGSTGDRLGPGVGSSLEIQDRRACVAGDDVRHIDWRAFGRSDQLLVRQYREEVLPRVELLVDDSASMAVGEDKRAIAVELPLLLERAARAAGARVNTLILGDRVRFVEPDGLAREGLDLVGRRPLMDCLAEAAPLFGRGALRILVCDLLSPLEPGQLVRRLARGAGAGLVPVEGATDLASAAAGVLMPAGVLAPR